MSEPVRAVPSAAAVEAAYREGCQHGGSFREEHGELVHVCACGATFRDDGVSRRDGDDLWQLHATEMELRAAYAVDAPSGALTVAQLAALLCETDPAVSECAYKLGRIKAPCDYHGERAPP